MEISEEELKEEIEEIILNWIEKTENNAMHWHQDDMGYYNANINQYEIKVDEHKIIFNKVIVFEKYFDCGPNNLSNGLFKVIQGQQRINILTPFIVSQKINKLIR